MTWSVTAPGCSQWKNSRLQKDEKLKYEARNERRLEREIDSAEGELKALEVELARLEKVKLLPSPASTKAAGGIPKGEVKKVRGEIEAQRAAFVKLENAFLSAQAESEKLQVNLQETSDELREASKSAELSPARKALVEKLARITAQVDEAKARLRELGNQAALSHSETVQKQGRKEDLALEQGRAAVILQRARDGLPELDNPELEASRTNLEKSTQQQIHRVKNRVESLSKWVKEAEEVGKKLAMRKADIVKGQAKVAGLAADVGRWEERNSAQAAELEELEEETKVKQCSDTNINAVKAALEAQKTKHAKLVPEQLRLSNELAQLATPLHSIEDEIGALLPELEKVERAEAEALVDRATLKEQVNHLKKRDCTDRLDGLRDEARETWARTSELESEIKRKTKANEKLVAEQSALKRAVAQEEQVTAQRSSELSRVRDEIDGHEAQISTADVALVQVQQDCLALQQKNENEAYEAELDAEELKTIIRGAQELKRIEAKKAREARIISAREASAAAKQSTLTLETSIKEVKEQIEQQTRPRWGRRERSQSTASDTSRSTAPSSVHADSLALGSQAKIQRMAGSIKALSKMSDELYAIVAPLRIKNMELLIQMADAGLA